MSNWWNTWCYKHSPHNGAAFAVQSYLADIADDDGRVPFPVSIDTIGLRARKSRRSVYTAIRALEQRHEKFGGPFLEVTPGRGAGHANYYRLLTAGIGEPPPQKSVAKATANRRHESDRQLSSTRRPPIVAKQATAAQHAASAAAVRSPEKGAAIAPLFEGKVQPLHEKGAATAPSPLITRANPPPPPSLLIPGEGGGGDLRAGGEEPARNQVAMRLRELADTDLPISAKALRELTWRPDITLEVVNAWATVTLWWRAQGRCRNGDNGSGFFVSGLRSGEMPHRRELAAARNWQHRQHLAEQREQRSREQRLLFEEQQRREREQELQQRAEAVKTVNQIPDGELRNVHAAAVAQNTRPIGTLMFTGWPHEKWVSLTASELRLQITEHPHCVRKVADVWNARGATK